MIHLQNDTVAVDHQIISKKVNAFFIFLLLHYTAPTFVTNSIFEPDDQVRMCGEVTKTRF